MNPLPIVLADIRKTRVGVIAVIVLIGLAVALGIAVSAQERALRIGSARAADRFDLIIGAAGSKTQLVLTTVYLEPAALNLIPGRLLAQISADRGVVFAAPVGPGDFYKNFPIVGSSADFVTNGGRVALAEGRVFRAVDEVVVGADVPLAIGAKFSPAHSRPDPIRTNPQVHEHIHLTVVGRMSRQGTPWDRAIIGPIEASWAVHGLAGGVSFPAASVATTDHVGRARDGAAPRVGPPWPAAELPGVPAIVVKPRTVADAYRLRARYGRGATMAVFPAEVLTELYARLGDARDVLALISIGTQALVIGAVLLAVFAALDQRRRKLAVLRALGASRMFVFATVWLQVMVMVVGGAVLGLALGAAGAFALSEILRQRTGITLPVAITAQELALALAIIAVGGVLAVIPAWSAYRQSVATALRS